ncbi:MAG TPA: hypothetical protein VKA89_06255 [Solirubrobacterales bacterium]|nr:hypothetical protein [Solirubrobacterales bacterium]
MSAKTRVLRAALLLGLATLALPAEARAGRQLDTGLVDLHAFSNGHSLAYARAKGAGARYVRILVDWRHVENGRPLPVVNDPTNPADLMYTWDAIDREVRVATRRGLVPMLQVYGAPQWAERCMSDDPDHPCDPDPRRIRQFAIAAARRYNGAGPLPRVIWWQFWNEPNLDYFLNPQYRRGRLVAPQLYRAMLNAFSTGVKSVRASNLVISAGLAPLARPGATIGPLRFMRSMLCMRGRSRPRPSCRATTRVDILATNPYTTGGPTHSAPGPNDVSIGDLPEMRRLLRAADRAGHIRSKFNRVPFWVTEFGWDSKPPDPGGLPLWLHARWAAEALYRMWRDGVTTVFWFQLRDERASSQPFGGVFESGLYRNGGRLANDRAKPVLRAFRFPFVALRAGRGARVWGRTPDSGAGRVAIQALRRGRWRRTAVLRADRHGIFQASLPRRRIALKMRARAAGLRSQPFSLRYVGDFYAPPFGSR